MTGAEVPEDGAHRFQALGAFSPGNGREQPLDQFSGKADAKNPFAGHVIDLLFFQRRRHQHRVPGGDVIGNEQDRPVHVDGIAFHAEKAAEPRAKDRLEPSPNSHMACMLVHALRLPLTH